MTTMTPEMEALKARLKATWMAGDYGISPSIWSLALWSSLRVSLSRPTHACCCRAAIR